jgi:putative spermidine/putrescine transport system permease protein
MRASGTASGYLSAAPLALLFTVAYLVPVGILVIISLSASTSGFNFTLVHYVAALTNGFNLGILSDTLVLGLQVSFATMLAAYPIGLLFMRCGSRGRAIIVFLILLPMLTNTVVRTFAWMIILGREGVINISLMSIGWIEEPLRMLYTRTGLIVALVQIFLPLMALPINASLARINDNLVKAAEGLGASRFYIFRTVILPLSLPGAIAGFLLTFAGSSTAFVSQTLVGGGRQIFMPLLIYQQAIGVQKWNAAAALSIVFAISILAIVFAMNRYSRKYLRGMDA